MKPTLLTGAACALALLSGSASAATVLYGATLTGAAERPTPVASTGTGTATLTLDDVTGAWTLTGSFANLTGNSNNAHIHGPADVNNFAGVIQGLTFTNGVTSGTLSGSGTFTSTQMADLGNQLYYVNVHSSTFGGGELRGQLALVPEPGMTALAGLLGLSLLRRRAR